MMHFPLFQISPVFPRKRSDSVENYPNFTISEQIFRFSSAKISDDLIFSHSPQFFISPYFRYSNIFPPFREIFLFSLLLKIPPEFVKFTCFLHTLYAFRFLPTLVMLHLCITQCTTGRPLYIGLQKL